VTAVNQRPHHFAAGIVRIPVRELWWDGAEVNRVAHFQTHARPHSGRLGCVEKAHDLPVDLPTGGAVEIAADCQHASVRVRVWPQLYARARNRVPLLGVWNHTGLVPHPATRRRSRSNAGRQTSGVWLVR